MSVKTKLHLLAENLDAHSQAQGRTNPVVKKMLDAASYVVDNSVIEILKRESAAQSVEALIEAGICRLPVSPMCVEFEYFDRQHDFVLLWEAGDGQIHANFATMEMETGNAIVLQTPVQCVMRKKTPLVPTFSDGGGFEINVKLPTDDNPEMSMRLARIVQNSTSLALFCGLLMLNVHGIEKEVIEVSRLNKARERKGKGKIPSHTNVYIGRVYKRDGSVLRKPGGGWVMPMHMRAGHTKRQRYGAGREKEKIIYIPPCIVNYNPEADIPKVKRNVRV